MGNATSREKASLTTESKEGTELRVLRSLGGEGFVSFQLPHQALALLAAEQIAKFQLKVLIDCTT
jgi:hypothetical protein